MAEYGKLSLLRLRPAVVRTEAVEKHPQKSIHRRKRLSRSVYTAYVRTREGATRTRLLRKSRSRPRAFASSSVVLAGRSWGTRRLHGEQAGGCCLAREHRTEAVLLGRRCYTRTCSLPAARLAGSSLLVMESYASVRRAESDVTQINLSCFRSLPASSRSRLPSARRVPLTGAPRRHRLRPWLHSGPLSGNSSDTRPLGRDELLNELLRKQSARVI